ncbi:uncharacterized protein LOC115684520 [Syzygium oleosum]|uniref:uncharacterized protein LOC115684520 n=1 Tax=Syzygium oleosum TaxID=219896 RepID=UPI0011D21829|nr:uncharacterized protein LOC115684520 [Syzygium oleosum]XP_056163702.1 uncharacterized protein LOC130137038 [Syzygium oleosum]XP_056166491.1 uncharacterized protein LOC115684520 [Syzygium oleosum]
MQARRTNSLSRGKRGLDSSSGEEGQPDRKQPALARNLSLPQANEERAEKCTTQISIASSSGMNMKIEQAKRFAVAQAQRDGSTGNYRIFDSPYGNFLVPVVPTRADLGV